MLFTKENLTILQTEHGIKCRGVGCDILSPNYSSKRDKISKSQKDGERENFKSYAL